MDGRLITEMRTACVSAIAVDHLASTSARVLAILGSGVQARSHLRALACLRTFDEVRVWSRTAANAEKLGAEIGATSFASAEEAVQGADVVLCLTSSAVPVLMGRWLKAGAMVCAIGAVTPERRELDSDVMRGTVVVESRTAAEREAGDILLAGATVDAEIGELLAGRVLPTKDGPVVFKSLGIAIADVTAARLVCERTGVLPDGPPARRAVTS